MVLPIPLVLVPALLCSARLYTPQLTGLWSFGPITVADHRRDGEIALIAARILANAPPHFALVGLSMGGYIALAMMREAPERIVKLALLDTTARPDTAEQTAVRRKFIGMAECGRLNDVIDLLLPRLLHSSRRNDEGLRRVICDMAADTGPEAFILQEQAIISRPDARPMLADVRCPTIVLVGEQDELNPPSLAKEIACGIAGARLVVIPQCGHFPTIERPEAVNAALAEWLSS